MNQPDHSKIINKKAKEIFAPYGIKQKGKSRIWLDDHGWFTTVIEFQPFHGRQGTTLNIGINFNWYEKTYFSFDVGYRQDVDFVDYNNEEEKFTNHIEELCKIALKKVSEYRAQFKDLNTAKSNILNHTFTSENTWGSYHKGTICGLTKDYSKQQEFYHKILGNNETFPWLNELKCRVESLISGPDYQNNLTEKIEEIIKETRHLKKLTGKEILFDN